MAVTSASVASTGMVSVASVEGSSEWISTKLLCVQFPTKTLCDTSFFVSAQMKTALNARFRAVLIDYRYLPLLMFLYCGRHQIPDA